MVTRSQKNTYTTFRYNGLMLAIEYSCEAIHYNVPICHNLPLIKRYCSKNDIFYKEVMSFIEDNNELYNLEDLKNEIKRVKGNEKQKQEAERNRAIIRTLESL